MTSAQILLRKAQPKAGSVIEASLGLQIRVEKLPVPEQQYRFMRERRFTFDFAWPDRMVAVEVDGEVHRIKARFHADIEKHALAVLAGWTVLRVAVARSAAGRPCNGCGRCLPCIRRR